MGSREAIREGLRDRRGIPALAHLGQDVRFWLRVPAKNPAFTAVPVVTLELTPSRHSRHSRRRPP